MYIYVYIYIYIYINVYTFTYIYIYIYIPHRLAYFTNYIRVHMHMCMHVCMYVHGLNGCILQERGLHNGSSELDNFVGRRLRDGRFVASVFNKTPPQAHDREDRALKVAEYILARCDCCCVVVCFVPFCMSRHVHVCERERGPCFEGRRVDSCIARCDCCCVVVCFVPS